MTYDPLNKETDRRDQQWHLDRRVPLTLIVAFATMAGQQIYAQGQTKAEFDSLRQQVETASVDRIHKQTVLEMFNVRDTQISGMKEGITDIKQSVKDNSLLLQQIYREMPRSQ